MRAKLDGRSWSETPVPLVTTASYRTGPPLGSTLGLVILLSWPETKAPPISAFEAVIKPLAVMPTQMAASTAPPRAGWHPLGKVLSRKKWVKSPQKVLKKCFQLKSAKKY